MCRLPHDLVDELDHLGNRWSSDCELGAEVSDKNIPQHLYIGHGREDTKQRITSWRGFPGVYATLGTSKRHLGEFTSEPERILWYAATVPVLPALQFAFLIVNDPVDEREFDDWGNLGVRRNAVLYGPAIKYKLVVSK